MLKNYIKIALRNLARQKVLSAISVFGLALGIAFLIAAPFMWYLMNKWLLNYPYRIHLEWWVFVIPGFSIALLAFLTVSFQAVKGATANPVKSLKTE